MEWKLDSNTPIYSQLLEQITHAIVSGEYAPGDKLPSVRDMAIDAAVNPNTMQKALSELERTGLVYTQRTAGRYITEDTTLIENLKLDLATKNIENFFLQMRNMGFSYDETLILIEKTVSIIKSKENTEENAERNDE